MAGRASMAYSRLILPLSPGRTKGFTGPLSELVGKAAMVNPFPHTSTHLLLFSEQKNENEKTGENILITAIKLTEMVFVRPCKNSYLKTMIKRKRLI